MPTCAHALPETAMAACRQLLAIRGQRLLKGAVGHADRAEHPTMHDFGEGNPDRINERELLDHDASTRVMGGGEGWANQTHRADIRRWLAVEYLLHVRQGRSRFITGEAEAIPSARCMAH